jgi:hypothetical protein
MDIVPHTHTHTHIYIYIYIYIYIFIWSKNFHLVNLGQCSSKINVTTLGSQFFQYVIYIMRNTTFFSRKI